VSRQLSNDGKLNAPRAIKSFDKTFSKVWLAKHSAFSILLDEVCWASASTFLHVGSNSNYGVF